MGIYIFRRLLALIPVLLGVSLLTFAIVQVTPGDPVMMMLGLRSNPQRVAELRHQLGLDDPLWIQYGGYVWNALHGDLGQSIRGNKPVIEDIMERFPATLQLTMSAMLLAILGGVSAGIIAATSKNRWVDGLAMTSALLGISVPDFWLAILLLLIFGVQLHWVSVTGGSGLKNLILPSICLAVGPAAILARLTRSSILEVLQQDYVRTARAKGLIERWVILRHVLKNALIPVITVLGLEFASMLGGAVFIESVFARSGLGRFAVNAISARDYPQIQGVVLFTATVYVLINLGIDLLYAAIDPRIQYD
jgi:ABC-type dipeptide/oligopeptide/nickel transport system permease component